jgi:hypothetical protein
MEATLVTLFSALIGFISSLIPEGIKLWRDQQDRAHELKILDLQLQQQREGFSQRLEEIRIAADSEQAKALYATWASDIRWVDALNATVRPMLAYAFFSIYCAVKAMQYSLLPDAPLPWQVQALWGEEDQAIFAGIIAFYFGQRAMGKLRK